MLLNSTDNFFDQIFYGISVHWFSVSTSSISTQIALLLFVLSIEVHAQPKSNDKQSFQEVRSCRTDGQKSNFQNGCFFDHLFAHHIFDQFYRESSSQTSCFVLACRSTILDTANPAVVFSLLPTSLSSKISVAKSAIEVFCSRGSPKSLVIPITSGFFLLTVLYILHVLNPFQRVCHFTRISCCK